MIQQDIKHSCCYISDNPVGSTTQPVKTELNWLKTPTLPHHAANKQYVDDAIDALPIDDRIKGMPGTRYKYSNSYGDLWQMVAFTLQEMEK
jgi:hypothetical protein